MVVNYDLVRKSIEYQLHILIMAATRNIDKDPRRSNLERDLPIMDDVTSRIRNLKIAQIHIAQRGSIASTDPLLIEQVKNAMDSYYGSILALQVGTSEGTVLAEITASQEGL